MDRLVDAYDSYRRHGPKKPCSQEAFNAGWDAARAEYGLVEVEIIALEEAYKYLMDHGREARTAQLHLRTLLARWRSRKVPVLIVPSVMMSKSDVLTSEEGATWTRQCKCPVIHFYVAVDGKLLCSCCEVPWKRDPAETLGDMMTKARPGTMVHGRAVHEAIANQLRIPEDAPREVCDPWVCCLCGRSPFLQGGSVTLPGPSNNVWCVPCHRKYGFKKMHCAVPADIECSSELSLACKGCRRFELHPASCGPCAVCGKEVIRPFPWWTGNPSKPNSKPMHDDCFRSTL